MEFPTLEQRATTYSFLLCYRQLVPSFQKENPPVVTKYIDNFADSKLNPEERLKCFSSLVNTLPFLSKENALRFIQISIHLAHQEFQATRKIPMYLLQYNMVLFENIPDDSSIDDEEQEVNEEE